MTGRAAALLLLLLGCGAEETGALKAAIRPTDGAGWNGNAYDTMDVKSYDTPSGKFRIFYASSGVSKVDPADVLPADGVPDFVSLVGASADATYDSTITRRGFRPPLDDSVYHDRPDYGGDGRFDIYLHVIGPGSDGYRVSEVCTDVPNTCSGYFVMTPSFRGTSYKSDREGAEVLTSHELFHNVQAAYDARQWQTWSEGTAVWNETQVFPDGGLRDFLGFLPAFLNEPERPFDKSMGTGPGGLYAYGSVLWPQYLSERFGAQIIREIWEGSRSTTPGRSPHFLDVTDKVLKERYDADLPGAWLEFTRWNLLVGPFAGEGRGYRLSARYPAVRLEPRVKGLPAQAEVQIDGLSARYLRLEPGLDGPQRLRVSLKDDSDTPASGTAYVLSAQGQVGEARPFPSGRADLDVAPGEAVLCVVSGVVRGGPAHQVTVRLEQAPAPPKDPEPPAGGCAAAPAGGPGAAPLLPALALAFLLLGRRRRALPV